MKNLILILILSLTFLASCANYGEEKNFGNLQIFYTESVTEADVDKLGAFLEEQKFGGETKISVQLNKEDDVYQFRMVSKEGVSEDEKYHDLAKMMAGMMSDQVFDGAEVEFHFCDEHLETLKVIKQ